MNNNSWNKKEKPLQALSGLGGGLAQPHVYSHKFSASGGTIVTPGNGSTYHIFATNGNFVVDDFDLTVNEASVIGGTHTITDITPVGSSNIITITGTNTN